MRRKVLFPEAFWPEMKAPRPSSATDSAAGLSISGCTPSSSSSTRGALRPAQHQ